MSTTAQIGSISWGTCRPEDTIPACLETLDAIDPAGARKVRWSLYHPQENPNLVAIATEEAIEGYWESADEFCDLEPLWDLDTLHDTLEGYAPPFCYFGASEGDGSDLGFWISADSLRDGIADGEIYVSQHGPEDEDAEGNPRDTDDGMSVFWLYEWERGSQTLYQRTLDGSGWDLVWNV